MYQARFGDVDLGVASFDHEDGQDWVVSSPHRGDKHVMQPRGRRQRRTPCEIHFIDDGGEKALLAFDELANKDTPHLFVHPLRGAYRAIVEGWSYSASKDEDGLFVGRCTFVEFAPPDPTSPASLVSAAGGAAGVRVARDRATAAAADLDLLVPEADDAAATAESWAAASSIDAGTVHADVTARTAALVDRMNAMKPSTSEEWELYRALLRTHEQLRQASLAVLTDVVSTVEYAVAGATPVMAIAARLYGGANARARADDIRRMNGLSSPIVAAGTKLKVPPP